MKKMYAAFLLLAIVVVGIAVWFSPLTGDRYAYNDNDKAQKSDGVAYPFGQTVRVDFDGEEADMYAYLDKMNATVVKTAEAGGRVIVYAYSPRVEDNGQCTSEGDRYNVMAAFADGRIAVGTPVLPGSY